VSGTGSGDPGAAQASTGDASSETDAVRAAVTAIRRGDRAAYGVLVERYQRRLFGLALMLVRDAAAAEEVAQDAFVRAFTHLPAYDEQRPFFPWIATIAVRLSQNWLRRHASGRAHSALDLDRHVSPSRDPLQEFMVDERDRALWRQVAALSSGQRAAVILHYREEMPVADVARALGVTSGTVKTLLFRARRRLREAMTDATPVVSKEKST
jgi:RNA polymerase sigma-70 factor (ECF subfamily)